LEFLVKSFPEKASALAWRLVAAMLPLGPVGAEEHPTPLKMQDIEAI
jgi:hypothetical protein